MARSRTKPNDRPLFDPDTIEPLTNRTAAQLNAWPHADPTLACAWMNVAAMIDAARRGGQYAAAPKLLERWEAIRSQLAPPAPIETDPTDDLLAALSTPALLNPA